MKRRDLFAMALPAAAAAGAALAPRTPARAQSGRSPTPARDGELRITGLELYPVGGRVFVRVLTDSGIDGWGETGIYNPRIAVAILETYRPLLLGVNPTRIEHIWQMLYRAHRNTRGGVLHAAAIAAVDIALWDLLGKAAGLPVHTLLGGPCRETIRYYPNDRAHKVTSHVLHPMIETPAAIDRIVVSLEQARERLGPSGYLMVDGHGKFTAQVAIQLLRRVEHLGILFAEEIVPPESNADLARVKRATSVPLAAGERMATIWPFRPLLESQSADVLNPDVVELGGISQLAKLAAVAEMYDVPLAPHGTHSLVGLAASLHVDAAVNNFLIQEGYEHIATAAPFLEGLDWPEADAFALPPGPGLGIRVDLEGIKEAAAKSAENGHGGVEKAYFLDDGSVADR